MQALDPITVHHLARGLHTILAGVRLNRFQQPSERELVIHPWWAKATHDSGESGRLYLCWQPQACCACVAPKEELAAVLPESNEKQTRSANSFAMLLKKYAQGAAVESVTAQPGEAALEFLLNTTNDLGERQALKLILEFTGKYANALLVKAETNKILALAHPVAPWMSQERSLRAGGLYALPPRPEHKCLLSEVTEKAWQAWVTEAGVIEEPSCWPTLMQQHVWGLTRTLADNALQGSDSSTAYLNKLHALLQSADFKQNNSGYTLSPGNKVNDSQGLLFHAACRTFYLKAIEGQRFKQQQQTVLGVLSQRKKGLSRQLKGVRLTPEASIQQMRQWADWLLVQLSLKALPRFVSSPFQLVSPEGTEHTSVELDVKLDWKGNSQKLYKLAQKAEKRNEAERSRQNDLESQTLYIDDLTQLIRQAGSREELAAIKADLIQAGLLKEGSKAKQASSKDRVAGLLKLDLHEEWPIWVGKSAKANGLLCGKLANSQDIWLHVQERPGSHVLIKRSDPHAKVPTPILEDALQLAVWFSNMRESANVPVVVCESLYVRKVPGSWPGHVTYQNEEGFFMTPNPERIAVLLASTEKA